MRERPLDPETEVRLADWMDQFAAEPIHEPPSFTAAAIWQKAELLRRWDAQRQAAAPIDVGERIQVGIGVLGAMVLVVWLTRQLPANAISPALAAALGASVLLLVSAAAFSVWALMADE